MSKKQKKNIFSEKPWNDTPYYDMFVEEWIRYGPVDINQCHEIYDRNRFRGYYCNFTKHECYKWPERI